VRQPHDALSFVKNNRLELRLWSLTDIELEVSQGGQTLNRLLLKNELQAARARLETAPASDRHPSVLVKGRDSPAAEAMPLAPTPDRPADRALLERELQAIRLEIQDLVGRVTPWEDLPTPAWHLEYGVAASLLTLMLGALCIAGVASLVTGYVMQRRAVAHERQRRRSLATSIRRVQGELPLGAPTRPAVRGAQLWGDQPDRLAPVTMTRRVRVSQKIRRRIRVRALSAAHDKTREHAAEHTHVVARMSQARPSAPAEVIEALGNLRRELMRLQRMLPSSTAPDSPTSPRGQV
jgi:hypothetical protein